MAINYSRGLTCLEVVELEQGRRYKTRGMPRCSNDDRYYQIADWRQTKPSPIHQICHNTYYTLFPLFPLTLLYMRTCPLSFVSDVRESSGTLGNLDVSLTRSGKISAVIYPHLVGGDCACSIATKDS